MMRELTAGRVVVGAREEREQHLVRRHADSEVEPEIAIVRHEDILAALERHRRAGLDRFVTFACRGERNLALAIELEAAVFKRPLHDHRAQHRNELLVGQAVALEGNDCGLIVGHKP